MQRLVSVLLASVAVLSLCWSLVCLAYAQQLSLRLSRAERYAAALENQRQRDFTNYLLLRQSASPLQGATPKP